MNKPNVNSVKLKLERNKLNYEYDPLTETLTLGGTQNLFGYKVINILIPIVLGVTMITVGFIAVADIGLLELAGLISLLYGSYGITLVKKKAKNNASKKIIQPGNTYYHEKLFRFFEEYVDCFLLCHRDRSGGGSGPGFKIVASVFEQKFIFERFDLHF